MTTRYRDALSLPQVPLTFGTALIGRSAYALVLLPLFYAVVEATGSVALAGTALALYGATASVLAPVRASLIDRFGARRVLTILVVLFSATLGVLAATSLIGGPGLQLVILAAVAGVVAPPVGPTMRVAWGSLTPNPELLKKGLSFDAVVEELLYLVGPAIAGLALAFIAPGVALIIPAVLVLAGGLIFVATPAVGAMRPRDAHPEAGGRELPQLTPLILDARFVGLLLPALIAGSVAGSLSVAVPVALATYGGSAAAGIALGLFAGGSALGGLLYGALKLPGSPARQLVVLSVVLLASTSLVAIVTGAVAVSVVLVVAGLFFSPVMIVTYVAAHASGGEHQQNSAMTWVNTSHNIGGAAGSALAGVLIQASGVPAAMGGMALGALLLLVVSALLSGRSARPEPEAVVLNDV
ncbi:MAG: MFS transporter [Rhodoglobus sp.]